MNTSNSSKTLTGKKDSHSDHAIAGAISGFVTRFLTQPLDVVKIRFQLQVEPIKHDHNSKYRSLFHTFYLIYREENISALWKGHVPAQLLSMLYGAVQFYCHNMLMTMSQQHLLDKYWTYPKQFTAGLISGCIATTLTFPFDTMRTRLVAQSNNHRVYKGVLHSCSYILRHESPRTFFYGLSPTLIQIGPHTGIQFVVYKACTDAYKNCFDHTDINFYNSMIAGSMSGFIAKTVVYPLDLSRKRLQIQGFQQGRQGFGKFFQCNGLFDCLRLTAKEEGVKGLFKGLIPSQLKATITTAMYFTGYQQSLKLIEALRSREII